MTGLPNALTTCAILTILPVLANPELSVAASAHRARFLPQADCVRPRLARPGQQFGALSVSAVGASRPPIESNRGAGATHARTADYKSDGVSTDLNGGRAPARTRAPRPPEAGRADECLLLLARAVQQYHTYPPTSPLCHHAVEACQRALVSLGHRDQLDFRVTPHALIVEEVALGRGTL